MTRKRPATRKLLVYWPNTTLPLFSKTYLTPGALLNLLHYDSTVKEMETEAEKPEPKTPKSDTPASPLSEN